MLPYPLHWTERLAIKTDSRILFVVLDGVGDVPINGETPLSAANTPNLDALARESSLGLSTPVAPGVAPGSGPGHLALFGYDPLHYEVGRGVLSALGIGLDLAPNQVAARGNFATLAPDGTIADRRAGRIPTDLNKRLIALLQDAIPSIEDVQVNLYTEAEYRFVLVLTGDGLGGRVADTDPGRTGEPPRPAQATTQDPRDQKTAHIIQQFVEKATHVLHEADIVKEHDPAPNTVLIRGVDTKPNLPPFQQVYKLTPGAIASYPMYRGVARLVGMETPPADWSGNGERTETKLKLLREHGDKYDFIFFHVKKTDSYGEDGNFEMKKQQIEDFDAILPDLLAWKPDVVLITGDHSTPVGIKAHSWHPLPVLIYGPHVRRDGRRFTEMDARGGSLGTLRHLDLMPLVLANALKMKKFGA